METPSQDAKHELERADKAFRARLGRWISVVSIGLASFVTSQILIRACSGDPKELRDTLQKLEPVVGNANVVSIAAFVVIAAMLLVSGPQRVRAVIGLRYLLTYPPTWVAIALSSVLLIWQNDMWGQLERRAANFFGDCHGLVIFAWITLAVHLLALVIYDIAEAVLDWHRRNESLAPAPGREQLPEDFKSLIEWLDNDEPVTSTAKDRYGHSDIARRIAERLLDPSEPAIALVGKKGSGKSTICELTKELLRPFPQVKIVRVSLWPFEDARAAVTGVLDALVVAIGESVSTLEVRGIPAQYLKAVTGGSSSNWLTACFGLMALNHTPEQLIEYVERVALATGRRYVLWIEDFERFRDDRESNSSPGHQPSRDTQSMLLPLFHMLDGRSGISFVFADERVPRGFDIIKLARYVEAVPSARRSEVMACVSALRKGCVVDWQPAFIDPASPKHRERISMNFPSAARDFDRWRDGRNGRPSLDVAISELLKNPRILKSVLRAVYRKWTRLVGEINFDDVLLLCIIRERCPKVFEMLIEHISLFRDPPPNVNSIGEPQEDPILLECRGYLKELNYVELPLAEAAIVSIFPLLRFSGFSSNQTEMLVHNPQGVGNKPWDGSADKWHYFLTEEIPPSTLRDQSVLEAIHDWNAGKNSRILDLCLQAAGRYRICMFASSLTASGAVHLSSEISHVWMRNKDHQSLSSFMELIHCCFLDALYTYEDFESGISLLIRDYAVHSVMYTRALADRLYTGTGYAIPALLWAQRAAELLLRALIERLESNY
ncbi:MAG TPA: P-loop NTPase fold protein, partial [Phycisphaerales bacterium]|nr:P-loop NTPase fold protein [Phycisphaerales bacterium]